MCLRLKQSGQYTCFETDPHTQVMNSRNSGAGVGEEEEEEKICSRFLVDNRGGWTHVFDALEVDDDGYVLEGEDSDLDSDGLDVVDVVELVIDAKN